RPNRAPSPHDRACLLLILCRRQRTEPAVTCFLLVSPVMQCHYLGNVDFFSRIGYPFSLFSRHSISEPSPKRCSCSTLLAAFIAKSSSSLEHNRTAKNTSIN